MGNTITAYKKNVNPVQYPVATYLSIDHSLMNLYYVNKNCVLIFHLFYNIIMQQYKAELWSLTFNILICLMKQMAYCYVYKSNKI